MAYLEHYSSLLLITLNRIVEYTWVPFSRGHKGNPTGYIACLMCTLPFSELEQDLKAL